MPSSRATTRTCARNSATCCCRWSFTRRWRRRKSASTSRTWRGPSPTNSCSRHPHVFGSRKLRTAGQVLDQWHKLKHAEKKHRRPSVTDGVPRHLPALMRAQEVQKKVARVGFDWSRANEVLDKIEEEIGELRHEIRRRDRRKMAEELGDLMFALVNLARFQKFQAEDLLNQCTKKFVGRFRKVEAALAARGKQPHESTLEEMEAEWQRAKGKKAKGGGRKG